MVNTYADLVVKETNARTSEKASMCRMSRAVDPMALHVYAV